MKFESFRLSDLFLKGEGNLHVVVLNKRTGQVFRFPKEIRKPNQQNGDIKLENIEINKLYKIAVNYKKYDVFQKFWGKDFLPKMRVCLFPKHIIDLIAVYIENFRLESRKVKSIITRTSYIEVQLDLTLLPSELDFFTNGQTICIELKPKFGILFNSQMPLDCRNKMSRFCLAQLTRDFGSKTEYCPCDMFSGNTSRMRRAIKCLIQNPQEKLRIFQNGQISNVIDKQLISNVVSYLFQQSHIDEEEYMEKFCHIIIQALTYSRPGTHNCLSFPYTISTDCQAHSWSSDFNDDDLSHISKSSVLGKLIQTSCLLNNRTEEMKTRFETLNIFLEKNNIQKTENIFDLWNEHLVPLNLPEDIIETIRILKKYLVCLTVRDCSIMIKFRRASTDKVHYNSNNAAVLLQKNGSRILSITDVIDISIKPLSKIQSNFEYEQKLLTYFLNI